MDTVSTPAGLLEELLEEVRGFRGEDHPMPLPEGVDERYSDRMTAVSAERYEERTRTEREFLERLLEIDFDELDRASRIDAQVLELQLRDRVAQGEFRTWLIPVSHAGGFYSSFVRSATNRIYRTVEQYDDYIASLQSFREHVQRQINIMRLGMEEGITLPRVVMADHAGTIRPHIVDDIEEGVFWKPFENLPATLPAEDRERILRDGAEAIRESVIPGFRELLGFMTEEYIPNARETVGLSDLPGGREFYEHRTRYFTTLDITPEEVHEIGLSETERLQAEMEAIIRDQIGFEGSYLEFRQVLRDDPRFYAETEEEYLLQAAYVLKRMDGKLLDLFRELPKTPYSMRAMPEHFAVTGPGAYYDIGSPGSQPGYSTFNLYDLTAQPLYQLEALAYHEGVPGHHLQIMLHYESNEISEFRSRASIAAFVEGWALYAERLGTDVGFLEDPYSLIGQMAMEHYRACRLVVDTGLHALGWSREQAIDWLEQQTGIRRTSGIDRYISGGGQALAYKMGELKVTELRERAEQELGERFDIRDFHYEVLRNGSVPLSVLEEHIEEWIETVLSGENP